MTQSFTIESSALRRASALARSVVVANKAIPVLNNVRLEAAGDRLKMLATDQDCWIELSVPVQPVANLTTTVGASLLDDIARNAPDSAQIEISLTATGAQAKAGRAKFRLPTLPADLFPPMNDHGIDAQIRMDPQALLAAVNAVAHVKAGDHLPNLQGVFIRPTDSGLEVAAYDGLRLSTCPVEADVAAEFQAITVPNPVISKLRGILDGGRGEISIGHNGRLALFAGSNFRFLTRLIEGPFVTYWTRLPALDGEPVMFSAKEMTRALNRVGLVQDKYHSGVALELSPDQVSLSISNPKEGDVNDVVPVAYAGPDVRIGFNLRFLKDAVAACPDDEAELHIDAEKRAHIFSRAEGSPRHMMAPMNA